ncbi:3-keto-disaccharide hydrolase [Roseiconus lacunae]|uniref:DUF1080 domain-containing protein n=2 Tax=Roseiconus lacunae TaxID=2605694 RepID=A0ABT7PR18_9BACT|nr:DUF1080 domain-containing protein [Roseiconus lacunae]MCD0463424.1 DUF1080 domain-containing protein [Roseiconus lacunae]MDM4018758.1 DUF1080 domain-containing protein [Roseiconus lacunae]
MKHMFSLALLVAAVILVNPVSAEEGWTSLFNGESLDGWSVKSGYATYEVEDGGVIVGKTAEGTKNTFLCTDDEYGDFELTFEVKCDEGLNSGVQIRSKFKSEKFADDYGGRVYGPQVEIETGPGQAGWIYAEATGRGWLSPEPQSKDKSVNQHDHFKTGEWNKYRIVAKGATIQTFINGQQIADLTDEKIYETHPKGVIGLQVHGIRSGAGPFEVRWRNLKLKSL